MSEPLGSDLPESGSAMPAAGHHVEASVWPMVVAAGLTLSLFGLVTEAVLFEILGILALVVGVAGWVREL